MWNFITKFLKYLFTVLYEIEKFQSGLSHKPNSVLNDSILKSNNIVIMSNTLFPGRGVVCDFDPMLTNDQKKILKRTICLSVAKVLLKIENTQIKEKAILIIRSCMSKLKFKYSLKPKWLEELKIIIRKEGIPVIGTTAIRQLNHRSLDDYIVEDVIGDYDLFSEVPMLSSDGFLKLSVISDKDNEQNSERFLAFTDPNDFKKREIEDKKLFMQRLRIDFSSIRFP